MEGWVYAPPQEPWLQILHEDEDLVVIDKPAGLLSTPGRDPSHRDSALARLQARHADARAAHRLDMDTSGLLLLALHRRAEAGLQAQLRERRVEKRYVARVAGHPTADEGLIDLPLLQEEGAPRSRVDPAGRPAQTRYVVLSRDPDGSALLSLWPLTGRSHQLRLHLLHLGHPILGDRFYAPPEALGRSPRLLLHAEELRLRHPRSGQPLHLRAPAPFR